MKKRKNIKVLTMILMMVSVITFMAGCIGQKESAKDQDWFFVDKEYNCYDETLGENLVIRFGKDGSYSYHCECGEPVGDSDLYEKYTYDEEKGVITILGEDDMSSEIQIVDHTDSELTLKINGETKKFVQE